MCSYGSPHMAEQKQDDQHEHTYSSYVRIQDVPLKIYQRRRTIGRSGERGSVISKLAVWHDDNDDNEASLSLAHRFLGNFIIVTIWVGYMHIYVYARVCVHPYMCMCVCVYIYIYTHPRTCVYAHAHTYNTHIYTHMYMAQDELDSAWVSNFKY